MEKTLIEQLIQASKTNSDIQLHLPTLFMYASSCDHVTEFGTRYVTSAWAFAAAKPKKLICYDIDYHENINTLKETCAAENVSFEFYQQDVVDPGLEIEETDLLFIDTFHRYSQLKQELSQHGNKARKYLIFHDTDVYGLKDEGNSTSPIQGLIPAINWFMEENPHWIPAAHYHYCNGLSILERKS